MLVRPSFWSRRERLVAANECVHGILHMFHVLKHYEYNGVLPLLELSETADKIRLAQPAFQSDKPANRNLLRPSSGGKCPGQCTSSHLLPLVDAHAERVGAVQDILTCFPSGRPGVYLS